MDLHRAIDAPRATRQMRLLGLVPSEAHGGKSLHRLEHALKGAPPPRPDVTHLQKLEPPDRFAERCKRTFLFT